jgi:hypothetical protein
MDIGLEISDDPKGNLRRSVSWTSIGNRKATSEGI